MAALGTSLVTLGDVAKTRNKQVGSIAEVMVKQNPILNDIPYMEMNEGVIHKESIRSSLPKAYYVKANQPIPVSKTTTEERTFGSSRFASKSQIGELVAERGGKDRIAFNRWNEAQGHLQTMANEHADLLIYGSPGDDNRKAPGLADVYSTLNPSEEVHKQVIDGGGSGTALTSIYLVAWGSNSLFGVYPKGTTAGLVRQDRSKGGNLVQIQGIDENGNAGHFYGYEEQFTVDHGLVVKDFRQAGRIANLDPADLKTGGISAADLIDLLTDLMYKIDSLENGQPVIYMNRTMIAFLDKQSRTQVGAAGGLTYMDYQGKPILSFREVPIRRTDAILNTEDEVTA